MTPQQAIEYGAKCLEKWKDWNRADQEQIEFYKAAIEALSKELGSVNALIENTEPQVRQKTNTSRRLTNGQ